MLTVGVICQVLRSGFRSTKAAGKGYTFRFFRSLCNVNMTACYEKCLWMCQWSPEDTGTWKIRSQLKIPRRGRAFAAVARCGHSDCEKLLGHLVGEFSSLGQSKAGRARGELCKLQHAKGRFLSNLGQTQDTPRISHSGKAGKKNRQD